MKNRIIAALLTFIMLLSLAACTQTGRSASTKGEVIPPKPQESAELTILLNHIEYSRLSEYSFFEDYIKKFETDFGVKIHLEKLGVSTNGLIEPEEMDGYMKQLMPKLIAKDGPELIFTEYMNMDALIKQQAVLDLRGKVVNLDKVYEKLLGEKAYYIPIGIDYHSKKIQRKVLEDLGIEAPSLQWTSAEYYQIRDQWLAKDSMLFNGYEYAVLAQQFLYVDSLYDKEANKIDISAPQVKKKINELRSYIFNGRYKLPEGYKYQNYYNMVLEDTSQENKQSMAYYDINNKNGHIESGLWANLFRAEDVDQKNEKYGTIMYPEFQDREIIMDSCGFLVNKNGKNLDLAYEFINGLLSDELQMALFDNERDFYPVSKSIEADILKKEAELQLTPEAIALKEFALQQLKDGKCKLWNTYANRLYEIYTVLYRDLTKFTLSDEPYDDSTLSQELQKLEDKYNIWLNE